MMDTFKQFNNSLDAPARHAFTATADGSSLPHVSRALYVGIQGALTVEMANGDVVTFANVAAGSILPIRIACVRAEGTTAGGVISLW